MQTTIRYKNAPLIEVVFEIRFAKPDNVVWPKLREMELVKELTKHLPIAKQAHVREVSGYAGGIQMTEFERHQLFSRDELVLAQVSEFMVTVNHLRPYTCWNEFVPYIEKVINAVDACRFDLPVQKLGLRYINSIDLPPGPVLLSDYFGFYPFIAGNLAQQINSFVVGMQCAFGNEGDFVRVQLASLDSTGRGSPKVNLDLDCISTKVRPFNKSDLMKWADEAHEQVSSTFERIVLAKLKKQFEEQLT